MAGKREIKKRDSEQIDSQRMRGEDRDRKSGRNHKLTPGENVHEPPSWSECKCEKSVSVYSTCVRNGTYQSVLDG